VDSRARRALGERRYEGLRSTLADLAAGAD
jgi:hypothetical protein